jgi:hypothetical protein
MPDIKARRKISCGIVLVFILSSATMSLKPDNDDHAEKHASAGLGSDSPRDGPFDNGLESQAGSTQNMLHQDLRGRHMQMIAMQVQHSVPVTSVY